MKFWKPWADVFCFDFPSELQQQLDEATSKVQVLQDELGVLRTYTDVHYPRQALRIVLLLSDIQNLKEQQQVLRPLLPCRVAREAGEGRGGRNAMFALLNAPAVSVRCLLPPSG